MPTTYLLRTFLTSYFDPICRRKVFAGSPRWRRTLRPNCHAGIVGVRLVDCSIGFVPDWRRTGAIGRDEAGRRPNWPRTGPFLPDSGQFEPNWRRREWQRGGLATLPSQGWDAIGRVEGLLAGALAHGAVEGEAQELDKEVDGVAGEVALEPAPITVFGQ